MQIFISRKLISLYAFVIVLVTMGSENAWLWAACAIALLLAVFVLGINYAAPVLLWLIGYSWIMVAADVLHADLEGFSIAGDIWGRYAVEAILLSLAALVVLALGMNLGGRLAHTWFRSLTKHYFDTIADTKLPNLRHATALYLVCGVMTYLTGFATFYVPALQQPIYAFSFLKFACVYVVASIVFRSGRGYYLLFVILGFEVISGATSYYAEYKEVIFVMLLALVGAPGRVVNQTRLLGVGALAISFVIWYSLVWTAIKPVYRTEIYNLSVIEKLDWIWSRIQSGSIDYADAAEQLVARVGYTGFYAKTLARLDSGTSQISGLYVDAIERIFMPRIFFPNKSAINDTELTTALTGQRFNPNTSVSVGYVAEAHVDFGVPMMFLPILLIGMALSLLLGYFMTRAAPLLVRQAFATVGLFTSFAYGQNINKALGGSLMVFIVLSIVLKFGFPRVEGWLYAKDACRVPVHGPSRLGDDKATRSPAGRGGQTFEIY